MSEEHDEGVTAKKAKMECEILSNYVMLFKAVKEGNSQDPYVKVNVYNIQNPFYHLSRY